MESTPEIQGDPNRHHPLNHPEIHKDSAQTGVLAGVARAIAQSLSFLYRGNPVRFVRPRSVGSLHVLKTLKKEEKGTFHILRSTFREEGWRAFPRHILPPLVANAAIGTIVFSTYSTVMKMYKVEPTTLSLHHHHHHHPKPDLNHVFLSGACAGIAQSFLQCPIEVLMYKIAHFQQPLRDSVQKLYLQQGALSLFQGLPVTMMRDSIGWGSFFCVYEFLKSKLAPHEKPHTGTEALSIVAAGAAAGATLRTVQ
eukprot:TRINITY_DN14529_c0_g1_i1.p1 TRINITY_DN14529_c0_g1~~TRINITY_DN14529_c0_g1_i1.p1  ORF type:complete len:253 (+),score=3.63 TRINITY_DN14529_c0_g1_i1:31-789(+)